MVHVYLVLQKMFGKVPHGRLLTEMKQHGIDMVINQLLICTVHVQLDRVQCVSV